MPLILSIKTNINNFDDLLANKNFINKIFKNEIILYKQKYNLIGFVTQPYNNHFVAYLKNLNEHYINSLNIWFKFDDMNGIIKEIKNIVFALNNIRDSEGIVLLIYLKQFNNKDLILKNIYNK